MNASISEPFSLADYGVAKRLTKARIDGGSHLYATHCKASGGSDGYVTVASQADGVHVLDVYSLHPIISHTLGPLTTFSCPAVSACTTEDGEKFCTTYAVIDSAPDVPPEESGRTVWRWREKLSGGVDLAAQNRKSVLMPHRICKIILQDAHSGIMALSPTGELTLTDMELEIKHKFEPSGSQRKILDTFVFLGKLCTFLPAESTPPRSAVILLLYVENGKTLVQMLAANEEDGFIDVSGCELGTSPEISRISCSASGFLTIFGSDGLWNSFQLEIRDGALQAFATTDSLQLESLTFLSTSTLHPCRDEISLLPLGSSFVLLAAISKTSTPEIVLLLWDLQYGVLLGSQKLSIPSFVSRSKENGISLSLVSGSSSQALLVLSPTPNASSSKSKSQTSASKSRVYVVPFAVPTNSTIANAMGRASAGVEWLAQNGSTLHLGPPALDAGREQVLDSMRLAIEQNKPKVASAALFEWEKNETADFSKDDGSGGGMVRPEFSQEFVKRILDIVLPSEKSKNGSSEVLRHLLKRRVVSASMVEGGFVRSLRLRNDWKSIELALSKVQDITENDLMETLQIVVTHHRSTASSLDAMQIDTGPTNMPTLEKFLSCCITYPTSSAALRLAIRQHLREAEDVVCLMDVLEVWISEWRAKTDDLLPSEVSKDANGVLVAKPSSKSDDKSTPPLVQITSFLQSLLDASFLTLLQHSSSHAALQRLHSHLEPELAFIAETEKLRGPLELFAKAQAKAVREGSEGGQREPVVDWRRRKKEAHERIGLAVGLYRLEELTF